MDGVLPVLGAPYVRRDSIQSEISVESDVTYRSLENGDISAMVGGPSKLIHAEMLGSLGGSTRSLVSAVDQGGSGGALLSEANSRVVYVNAASKNAAAGFCDNKVVTAKYTKLNFIPRFFYGRLSQVSSFCSPQCLLRIDLWELIGSLE